MAVVQSNDDLIIDFSVLGETNPSLVPFLRKISGKYKSTLSNWHDPAALRALTGAILKTNFKIDFWDIPPDRLCPPVPNRFEYLCWIRSLLDNPQEGISFKGLDIGTGASCIYPLMGSKAFGWNWIGTEIDAGSYSSANSLITRNKLESKIKVRKVESSNSAKDFLIQDVIEEEDGLFDFCCCNPPFFNTSKEAERDHPHHACPGAMVEMVCDGGEFAFLQRLIRDSVELGPRVRWYTAMTGKKETLKQVMKELRFSTYPKPVDVRSAVLNIGDHSNSPEESDLLGPSQSINSSGGGSEDIRHGSKTRRWVVAWSFDPKVASLNLPKMNALAKKRSRETSDEDTCTLVEVPALLSRKHLKIDYVSGTNEDSVKDEEAVVSGCSDKGRKRVVQETCEEEEKRVKFVSTPLRQQALTTAPCAVDMDRTCDPPNLFSCDLCGRRIAAGLAGFEIYYSCCDCDEFDICNDCAGVRSMKKAKKKSKKKGGAGDVCIKTHFNGEHKFKRVDRNYDSTSDIDEAEGSVLQNITKPSQKIGMGQVPTTNDQPSGSLMQSIQEEVCEETKVKASEEIQVNEVTQASLPIETASLNMNQTMSKVSALDLLQRMAELASTGASTLPNFSAPHELQWCKAGVGFIDTRDSNVAVTDVKPPTAAGGGEVAVSSGGVKSMEDTVGVSLTCLAERLERGEPVELGLMGNNSKKSDAKHFVASVECCSTDNGMWKIKSKFLYGEWGNGYKLFIDAFPNEVLRSNRRWRRKLLKKG